MAEASGGSAAPAAPASGAPAAGPASPAVPPSAAAESTWDDKTDAEFFEKFAKSPYAKVKTNKGEFVVKSKADFEALHRSHQRVSGVNDALAEAKKHRADAERIAAEAKAERDLFAKAKSGDPDAWKQLGLQSPSDRQQFEADMAALSPEDRAIVEENMRLRQEADSLKRAEMGRKAAAEREQLLSKVRTIATDVSKALGIEKPETAHLQAIAQVMDDAAAGGYEMSPEDVRDFVLEKMEAESFGRVTKLPHAKTLEKLGDYLQQAPPPLVVKTLAPLLSKVTPDELTAALGEQALPFAKALSAWYVAKRRAPEAPPTQPSTPQQSQRPSNDVIPPPFGLLR